MGWKGESRRHSLSRKGIKTNIDDTKRLSVRNFVARGNNDLIDNPFFTQERNTVPHLAEPKYYEKYKNQKFTIIYMTISEYEEAIKKGFDNKQISDIRSRIKPESVEWIKSDIMRGNKYSPPSLYYYATEYSGDISGTFGQEGHHRAVASEELGKSIIPVMVLYPARHTEEVTKFMTSKVRGELGL